MPTTAQTARPRAATPEGPSHATDSHPVAKHTKRDGPVWRGDCIEFFIDPRARGTLCCEISFNAAGAVYDANVLYGPGPLGNAVFDKTHVAVYMIEE